MSYECMGGQVFAFFLTERGFLGFEVVKKCRRHEISVEKANNYFGQSHRDEIELYRT